MKLRIYLVALAWSICHICGVIVDGGWTSVYFRRGDSLSLESGAWAIFVLSWVTFLEFVYERKISSMRSTVIAVSVLLCLACEKGNEILFESPLPTNGKVYTTIPGKLTGSYVSLKDSSELIITKDQIVKVMALRYATAVSQLDSAERLMIKGDTSFSFMKDELEFNVIIRGDSLFESAHYPDTIFRFAEGDAFRKYKEYYFSE